MTRSQWLLASGVVRWRLICVFLLLGAAVLAACATSAPVASPSGVDPSETPPPTPVAEQQPTSTAIPAPEPTAAPELTIADKQVALPAPCATEAPEPQRSPGLGPSGTAQSPLIVTIEGSETESELKTYRDDGTEVASSVMAGQLRSLLDADYANRFFVAHELDDRLSLWGFNAETLEGIELRSGIDSREFRPRGKPHRASRWYDLGANAEAGGQQIVDLDDLSVITFTVADPLVDVVISPDDSLFAVSSTDTSIHIYDAVTLALVSSYCSEGRSLTLEAFRPDATMILLTEVFGDNKPVVDGQEVVRRALLGDPSTGESTLLQNGGIAVGWNHEGDPITQGVTRGVLQVLSMSDGSVVAELPTVPGIDSSTSWANPWQVAIVDDVVTLVDTATGQARTTNTEVSVEVASVQGRYVWADRGPATSVGVFAVVAIDTEAGNVEPVIATIDGFYSWRLDYSYSKDGDQMVAPSLRESVLMSASGWGLILPGAQHASFCDDGRVVLTSWIDEDFGSAGLYEIADRELVGAPAVMFGDIGGQRDAICIG